MDTYSNRGLQGVIAALDQHNKSSTIFLKRGSIFRFFIMGAGMAYAMENDKASYIPLIFFFPMTFSGYTAYTHRQTIKNEAIDFFSKIKQKRYF